MAGGRYCEKEVLPFTAMVAVECTNVGVNVLFKAATEKGLSYYAFIAYSFAVSTLFLLLPLPFVFRWCFITFEVLNFCSWEIMVTSYNSNHFLYVSCAFMQVKGASSTQSVSHLQNFPPWSNWVQNSAIFSYFFRIISCEK